MEQTLGACPQMFNLVILTCICEVLNQWLIMSCNYISQSILASWQ